MAYFVAKELHMRPTVILNEWTCEELMVAYGEYANHHSNEYVEMTPKKEWAKHKPPITWLDRWAVLFVDKEQMTELAKDQQDSESRAKAEADISEAAKILFS